MHELLFAVLILLFVVGFCGFLFGIVYGQALMLDETSISTITPRIVQDYYPTEKNFFDNGTRAVF